MTLFKQKLSKAKDEIVEKTKEGVKRGIKECPTMLYLVGMGLLALIILDYNRRPPITVQNFYILKG